MKKIAGRQALATVMCVMLLGGCASAVNSPVASEPSTFTLSSSAMLDGGTLPVEFTCDGDSSTPPIEWTGAPDGTLSYAVVMHHVPGEGDAHWYWVIYNLDASVTSLAANETVPGELGGNSVNGQNTYAPPCSKGPGEKRYTFTVYALDAEPALADADAVSRDVLLAAIDGHVLGEAALTVGYSR